MTCNVYRKSIRQIYSGHVHDYIDCLELGMMCCLFATDDNNMVCVAEYLRQASHIYL